MRRFAGSGQVSGRQEKTSAVLSSLALGNLTLNPAFSPDVTSYSAETTNETNTVTAAAASGTTVSILVNDGAHTSGQPATWNSGTNTVTVTASKTGLTSTAYTVTVTKKAES